ncbi:hypothetical protein TELCIR_20146, partial [Teladorsagia circumcincta]
LKKIASKKYFQVVHTTPDGYVFIAFWLLFLLLSFLATITFVLFYATAHSVRSTLLQDVFQNVEYDLLDDFSSAEPEWIDIGKRNLKMFQPRTSQVSKKSKVAKKGLLKKNSLDSEKDTKGGKHSSKEKSCKTTKFEKEEDAKGGKLSSKEKVAKVAKLEGVEDAKANKHSGEENTAIAKRPEIGGDVKAHKPGSVGKSEEHGSEEKVAIPKSNEKPGQSKKSESEEKDSKDSN